MAAPAPVNLTEIKRPPTTSLHHAARDDKEQTVNEWIDYCKSHKSHAFYINQLDRFGYTPLHYAAKFNRYDILVSLIEAGADPKIPSSEEKFTALHFCARYLPRVVDIAAQSQESEELTQRVNKKSSSWKAINYLISLRSRIEVNAKDRYGVSPLHLACMRGNVRAANVLLRSNDIQVNIVDKNGDTPLHEACLNGHVDLVKILLEWFELTGPENLPVNINLQNSEDQTPLHLACREGHLEIVQNILKKIPSYAERRKLCETVDNEASTALHLACESGNSEIVKTLVLNGAQLEVYKVEDVAPLHIAARYGHKDVADTLLTGNDEVDMVDESGQTPLHYAADQNQVEMIYFLVERSADISATDMESYTPLMVAAYKGHIDAFKALLDLKSNLDDIDEDNKTVVHLAAEQNHSQLLKDILKLPIGLDLAKSTDARLHTPLHVACRNGHLQCVEVLLQYRTTIRIDAKDESNRTPLHYAAARGHVEVVKSLLESKKDCILDEDESGDTPLHLAAANGYSQAVKVLLDYKADCDSRNAKLWTPLDAAAFKGHAKVVQLLIEAEADLDPTDKEKSTPLHHAALGGHLDVVKVLLENKADVTMKDTNGNTPLDQAIISDNENIAMAMVRSSQWKSALRHTNIVQGVVTTPLRRLVKKMPAVANEVFNRCSDIDETVNGVKRPGHANYKVHFDYEFLEDFQDKPSLFTRLANYFRGSTVEAEETLSMGVPSEAPSNRYSKLNKKREELIGVFKRESATTDWGPVGFSKKLHPLSIMVENDSTGLLKHPLVTSLLNLKWSVYGRTAYSLNLFIYIIFVVFLTSFALVAPNPQSDTCRAISTGSFGRVGNTDMFMNNTAGCMSIGSNASGVAAMELLSGAAVCSSDANRESCGVSAIDCGDCQQSSARSVFLVIAAIIVIVFAIIRLTFELFQFIALGIYYLKDWVNFVEIVLFVCAFTFSFVFTDSCRCPTTWQWQIGCVAVFLAWIDFIIFIRKLPLTGIYVLMFVDIFKTFWKMFLLTVLLLVAFALAFYMALDDPSPPFARGSFATPGRSLLKTMTMTTGEFEYDSIFRQFPGGAEDGAITNEIPFFPVSVVLWIVFLILMPILLTNLLVGLAVDDIKGIQSAAELRRLALQVELALSVEELMPVRLRRYFITFQHTIQPNRKLNAGEFVRYRLFGSENDRFDSPDNIHRSLHPPVAPIEQVQTRTDDLVADIKQMKEAIQDLVKTNGVMADMIRELAAKKSPSPPPLVAAATDTTEDATISSI